MTTTISIGSDHAGYALRKGLIERLQKRKDLTIIDRGPITPDPVDYPDFAALVANDVLSKNADYGILMCSTGIGISISANKFPGIRAALVWNEDGAAYSRLHNNSNIICFGGKYQTPYLAEKYVDIFLKTPFESGRHERRVEKISALEKQNNH